MLACGSILWRSVKQKLYTSSTIEAEFVACYEATIHALWLRNFISRLGVVDSIARPLRIYCDNSAAVFFSKNDKYSSSSASKHLKVKFLIVKEEVRKQRVIVQHISTKFMIADPLTKGLAPKTFTEHVDTMGLGCHEQCQRTEC